MRNIFSPYQKMSIVTITILIFQLFGCRKQSISTDFPDSVNISSFISEHTLSQDSGKIMNLDVFGIMEFKIVDSLMIVSSSQGENSWYLYRIPSCDSIMSLLNQGGGPMEVDMNIPTTFATFNKDSIGHIIATIPQNVTKKIIKVDVNESIDSTRTVGSVMSYDNLSQFNIITKDLTGDRFVMIDINPDNLTVDRNFIDHGNQKQVKAFEILNKKKANSMQEIGTIIPGVGVSPDSEHVVEIVLNSPVINLYSFDGNQALSIIGDFEEVKQIEKAKDSGILLPYYKNVNSYPDFFTILQPIYNSDYKEVGNNLLFFSWEGKPLEKLTIPMPDVRNTDIDLLTGTLYVLFPEEDVIRSFSLNGIEVLNDN